ncbi:hypothetical protein X474_00370 [Dethiosulfatarculus sandiegensis]|uniref:Uncharacterized protein n=1 Tax=Dethiosulfatarculus sandiegensis TaxID=1429043 RepID=A0A0D2GN40_9BACT|nr:hypothetical protein X474_00370 [Dethiosulfatarculus sandiegensis]
MAAFFESGLKRRDNPRLFPRFLVQRALGGSGCKIIPMGYI